MSDLCIECNNVVRGRQHAVTCDICDRWQHRKCDTGYHRRINGKAGRGNVQMYVLIPLLYVESELVSIQAQQVNEHLLTRYRRPKYRRLHEKLEKLWDAYDTRELITSDFLTEVAKVYVNDISMLMYCAHVLKRKAIDTILQTKTK